MKFCEKCKKVYDNSASFCPYCGANLIDVEKDSEFCNLNKDTTSKNSHVNSNNSTNEIAKKRIKPLISCGFYTCFFSSIIRFYF